MLVDIYHSLKSKSRYRPLINLALLLYILLTSVLHAAQTEGFELGEDYQMLAKTNHLSGQEDQLDQLESVPNIELFYWIGSESSYQVDAQLALYLDQHPEYSFRRTPLVARVKWREQAYLQAIIRQIPEQTRDLTMLDIYRQCLTDCEVFSQVDASVAWLLKDVEQDLKPVIDYEKVWQQEKKYQKRADLFSITQVPTIIINETYQVNASQAKTAKRMLEIVDHLLPRK